MNIPIPSALKGALLALVLTLAGGLPHTARADEKIPLPRDDPFYVPPAGYASLPNGTILKDRKINAQYLIGLFSTDVVSVIGNTLGDKIELLKNLKIDAYQLLYKSTDSHDQPVAEVTTLLVPQGPYLGKGPRPLISYGNAINGLSDRCWPSYTLRAGLTFQDVTSVAIYDTVTSLPGLLAGYAISYPDHLGPHSQWLAGRQMGHAVLDSIRASLNYAPAGLSADAKVGLLGYSGGGGAQGWAAALHTSYAPELNIVGAALGMPANANLAYTFEFNNNKPTSGVLPIGTVGLARAYPESGVDEYLNAAGHQMMDQVADACIIDGILFHHLDGPFENYTVTPAVKLADSKTGKFLLETNSLVNQSYIPDMPVLIYGDPFDDLVGIKSANDLAIKYCKAGAEVEVMHTFNAVPIVPDLHVAAIHIADEFETALPSLGYLANRFEGRQPRNDCSAGSMNVWSSALPLPYYPFVTQ